MKQFNSCGNFIAITGLGRFIQSFGFDQLSKGLDVFRKEYGIMYKFFVTLIAEGSGRAFHAPWTVLEDWLALRPSTVRGAAEEPFGNIMVPSRVRATLHRRLGVLTAPMQLATTYCAGFFHPANPITRRL